MYFWSKIDSQERLLECLNGGYVVNLHTCEFYCQYKNKNRYYVRSESIDIPRPEFLECDLSPLWGVMEVKPPKKETLRKYGLDLNQWIELVAQKQGRCWVCGRTPDPTGSVRFVVDHEHVKDYKKKSADEKRKFIRGILCWNCNKNFLGKGITTVRARNVYQYLVDYDRRTK